MATKRRRGSAKRTYAKQEAARRRGAPGKRFVGETAAQSEGDRRRERKKVARMARAAREARPAEAAHTAGARPSKGGAGGSAARRPPPTPPVESGQSEAAFRAAEERAAAAGAEVEPLERPLASVSRLAPRDEGSARTDEPDGGAVAVGARWEEPSADVSAADRADRSAAPPPLGGALGDLVRSALGLARTVVSVPFRLALAVPRLALRAVMHG